MLITNIKSVTHMPGGMQVLIRSLLAIRILTRASRRAASSQHSNDGGALLPMNVQGSPCPALESEVYINSGQLRSCGFS
jgi:hypothetical protein